MGELGWFLTVTAAIVALVGGGFLVFVFAWFAKAEGQIDVGARKGSLLAILPPVAGLILLAGLVAGFLRLVRPYLH